MGSKSRETIYGASVRAAAERATEARKQADRLAVEAWNARMLGFQGPAQPSPTLGDAINAGYRYLEVKCLGCNTHQTVALDIVRRPRTTPVHELHARHNVTVGQQQIPRGNIAMRNEGLDRSLAFADQQGQLTRLPKVVSRCLAPLSWGRHPQTFTNRPPSDCADRAACFLSEG